MFINVIYKYKDNTGLNLRLKATTIQSDANKPVKYL